jgi:hypothetical protein
MFSLVVWPNGISVISRRLNITFPAFIQRLQAYSQSSRLQVHAASPMGYGHACCSFLVGDIALAACA